MSAFSRFPRTPATGIIHTWRTSLAYGQVRESSDPTVARRFVLLCPIPERATWSVLLLSPGPPEITEHGVRYIQRGTRVVEP